jgi:hypothetical protein
MDRLEVGLRVSHDFEQGVAQVEGLLGGVVERLEFDLLLRRGVGGRPEENADLDGLVGDALGLEQPLQHEAVEGHLEAVFHLDLNGRFHVANEDEEGAVRLALQPHKVKVAPEQPARQFHVQPGLEEQHGLPRLELAGLGDDFLVVVRPVVVLRGSVGVLDRAEVAAQGLLDASLELVARQRQQRRDPLRGHVVVLHELLPGPFRQAEAQKALALLQAHELRHVRGRQP